MANSYSTIIGRPEEEEQQAPVDSYKAQLQDQEEQQTQSLKGSLNVGAKENPDEHAEAARLAKKFDVPVDFAKRNKDSLMKENRLADSDYRNIIKESPATAKFLSNPDNAAMAHDDIESLRKIEKGFARVKPRFESEEKVDPFFSSLPDAAQSGWHSMEVSSGMLGLAYGKGDKSAHLKQIVTAEKRRRELEAMRPSFSKEFNAKMEEEGADAAEAWQQVMTGWKDYKDGEIIKALKNMGTGGALSLLEGLDMARHAVARPKGLAYGTVEQFANMVPGMGLGVGAGAVGAATGAEVGVFFGPVGLATGTAVGGTLGFAGGAFAGQYPVEVGAWIQQELGAKGVDMTNEDAVLAAFQDKEFIGEVIAQAERKGLGTAGVEAFMSLFAGGAVAKAIKSKGTKAIAGAGVKSVSKEMAGESMGEFVGQAAAYEGDLSKVNMHEVYLEGILSLGQSGVTTIAQSGREVMADQQLQKQEVKEAEEKKVRVAENRKKYSENPVQATVEVMDEMDDIGKVLNFSSALEDVQTTVRESKIAERDPEKVEEFIEQVVPSTEGSVVYFQEKDWDDHWNSRGESPVEKAKEMFGTIEGYMDAKTGDGNIAVPVAKFVAKTTNDENFNELNRIVRSGKETMSVNEAAQKFQEIPEIMEQITTEAKELPDTKELRQKMVEQLKGTYKEQDARVMVDVVEGIFKSWSTRNTQWRSPQELMQRFMIDVAKEQDARKNKQTLSQTDTKDENFKRWFGDSKVVDDAGEPLVVYHGTVTNFEAFDTERANPESDLGKGIYLTNNSDDVGANYAGIGPDMENKIQRRAEQLESNEDMDADEARKQAESEFVENDGETLEVYVSMKNPAVLGGENETILTYELEMDEETGDIVDESGSMIEFADNLRQASRQYSEGTVEEAISKIFENGEEISLSEAIALIKETEEFSYFQDDEGNLVSTEIIREAIEMSGFDGIIDNTVNTKFGSDRKAGRPMDGVSEGTTHYIAFSPEQIKSVNNNGDFNPNDKRILYQGDAEGNRQTPIGFYSAVEAAVLAIGGKNSFKQMPADQLWNTIKNTDGLKQEELDYIGLEEWLTAEGKNKVTKEAVLAFIREHGVQVEQVVYSDSFQPGRDIEGDPNDEDASQLEWGEEEWELPDHAYDSISEDSRYDVTDYHMAENTDEWQAALKEAKEQNPDETEERQSEIAEEELQESVYQSLLEDAESNPEERYGVGRISVDHPNMSYREDWDLVKHHNESEWHSSHTGQEYGYEAEEAKIQYIDDLARRGDIYVDLVANTKKEDVTLGTPTIKTVRRSADRYGGIAVGHTYRTIAFGKKLQKDNKAEAKEVYKESLAENESLFDGDEKGSAYERNGRRHKMEALKGVRLHFLRKAVELHSDPNVSGNTLVININAPYFSGKITGNYKDGWAGEIQLTKWYEPQEIDLESSSSSPEELIGYIHDRLKFQGFFPEEQVAEQLEGDVEAEPVDINKPIKAAKWAQYTEPGGENYREVMLTLPKMKDSFTNTTHNSERNVIGFMRLKDRITADGKKQLFAEEMQGDWTQEGRQYGYKSDVLTEERKAQIEQTENELDEVEKTHKAAKSKSKPMEERHRAERVFFFDQERARLMESGKKELDLLTMDDLIPLPGMNNEFQFPVRGMAGLGEAEMLSHVIRRESNGEMTFVIGDGRVHTFSRNSDEAMLKFFKEEYLRKAVQTAVENLDGDFKSMPKNIQELASDIAANDDEVTDLWFDRNVLAQKLEWLKGKQARPDAPFRSGDGYAALLMKRLIRMAAEGGYDSIGWTPGAVHSKRWGTAMVSWKKNKDGVFLVDSTNQSGGEYDGNNIEEMARRHGHLLERRGSEVKTQKELFKLLVDALNYSNKNIFQIEEIAANTWERMKGEESGFLAPRHEGMAYFYDNMLPRKVAPNVLKKLDKKAKVTVSDNGALLNIGAGQLIPYVANKDLEQLANDYGAVYHVENEGNFDDPALQDRVFAIIKREVGEDFDLLTGDLGEVIKSLRVKFDEQSQAIGNQVKIGDYAGAESIARTKKVWRIDLTEKLKKKAQAGQTLFQDDNRGEVNFDPKILDLFQIILNKGADRSTFMHEMGHIWLETTGYMVEKGYGDDTLNDMYKNTLTFLGVNSRAEIKKKHHEKFADAFETYLAEGIAPTPELRKSFEIFQQWLINIYRQLAGKKVELSDEMREVFDRMVATDDEIADARSQVGLDDIMFDDATVAGLGDKKAAKYIELTQEAKIEATEKLTKKHFDYLKKKQTAKFKAMEKEVRLEITEKVEASPYFMALSAIRDGKLAGMADLPPGLETLKMNERDLIARYGQELVDKLPKGVTVKKDGLHYTQTMTLLGFENADDMIELLLKNINKEKLIKALVDRDMSMNNDDPLADEELQGQAASIVQNDKQAQVMRMELDIILEKSKAQGKEIAARLIRELPTIKEVKRRAKATVERMTFEEAKPYKLLRSQRKARRKAAQAFKQGNLELAFNEHLKAYMAMEMYQVALGYEKARDKAILKMKKAYQKKEKLAKRYDYNYIETLKAVLAMYDIGPKSDKTPMEHLALIREYAPPEQMFALMSAIEGVVKAAGPFKQIKIEDFNALVHTFDALWTLAREEKEVEVNGERLSVAIAAKRMSDQAQKFKKQGNQEEYTRSKTNWEKTKMQWHGVVNKARRIEFWVDLLDMRDINGNFRRFIYSPVKDAETEYIATKKEFDEKFLTLAKTVVDDMTHEPIRSKELGHQFNNKAEVMGAILHMGNESNAKKLLIGRNWGDMDENGVLDMRRWQAFFTRMQEEGIITKADMDFVQGLWDLMEEVKPRAQRASKKMFGFYFDEITSWPIETKWGSYKGGYAPAAIDPELVPKMAQRQELEQMTKANDMQLLPYSGGAGMTKNRVANYNKPLLLDINLVVRHIDQVLKFAIIKPAVYDVSKILRNEDLETVLHEIDPTAMKEILLPALNRADKQQLFKVEGPAGAYMHRMARFVQNRIHGQIFFANAQNVFEMVSGFFTASSRVGFKNIAKDLFLKRAAGRFFGDPALTAKQIAEWSPYMRNRQDDQIFRLSKESRDIFEKSGNWKTIQEAANKHTYFGQVFAQNLIDSVVWSASYDRTLNETGSHDRAVRQADTDVRLTQGERTAFDISSMESNALLSVVQAFMGYFNVMANLNVNNVATIMKEDIGLTEKSAKMFHAVMFGYVLTAAIPAVIRRMLEGKWDLDDDDEWADELADIFLYQQLRFGTAMVPLAGPLLQTFVDGFDNKVYNDRTSVSPLLGLGTTAAGAANAAIKLPAVLADEDAYSKRDIRDSLTFLGVVTGIPVGPAYKPLNYVEAVSQGEVEPDGPIDYARGLITGKPGRGKQ